MVLRSTLIATITVIAMSMLPAHAVRFRWVAGAGDPVETSFGHFQNGGAETAIARACYADTGFVDYQITSGYHDQYGSSINFKCLHGGFLDIAYIQTACYGYPAEWGAGQADLASLDALYCIKQQGKSNGDGCKTGTCGVGNPIFPGSGNKFQSEVDFVQAGVGGLEFKRYYNGNSGVGVRSSMGLNWRSTIDRSVVSFSTTTGAMASVYRENGRLLTFSLMSNGSPAQLTPYDPNAQWVADADVSDRLVRLVDGSGNTTGWSYYVAASDAFEAYNADGSLSTLTSREGQTLTLSYSGGLPQSLSDAFGRSLAFTYDGSGHIATVTDPAGQVYQYAYDATDVLTSVTYPDTKVRQYLYNEPAYTNSSSLSQLMTGIVDELGNRFATFTYDANGLALSTEHAGGVDKYSASELSGGFSTVVDPIGVSRSFAYRSVLGVSLSTGIDQPCPHCGPLNVSATTYDQNGNALSQADFNGHKKCYAYDTSRNLETARVEGALSADTCSTVLITLPARSDVRKITTQWHATWRLPSKVAEPNKLTTYVYNGDTVNGAIVSCAPSTATVNGLPIGVLCSKTVQQTTDTSGQQGLSASVTGSARIWTYTYNAYGRVLSATDPNLNSTVYAYYDAANSDVAKRGNISSITNAAGHVTSFTGYDLNGHLLSMADANGMTTSMTYHPRGWLTSKNAGGETTSYDYDPAGQLQKITLPDASYIQYTYDPAHRVTQLQDGLGNKVVYTLDALGNRISEDSYDPSNQLAATRHRVFDSLNRLHQSVGAK